MTTHPLEALRRMEYPGRVVVLGRDPAGLHDVIVYAVTGRSPSSQARRLEREGNAVVTKPTDPEILKTGQPDLLVYPAVLFGGRPAVSNGRQTDDVARTEADHPVAALAAALRNWSYEPDPPIYTPRISGLLWPDGRAALSLIKRGFDGSARRLFFEFSLHPGRAEMIATYAGPNRNPLPVFEGEPLSLTLVETTAKATAGVFYEALRPEGRSDDFRVAAACLFLSRNEPGKPEIALINRHERTGA
ncbi:MAG: IMP cyclohydrolase [Acidobacteriota bacterium]|jgi:IMP cyclohydrolase-like protein.|nr:hypothetical protein [Acidobacteriota bacterium]OQB59047.1 MAG: IMP cyclohydrolase [Candidatus Aminicenantes bacterium ADurb.Bin147]HNQ80368.1 IMP cyclohydrolase [Candidatus Aminicenantes bacterium]MDD8010502.1 IMP cyclohydrolase [Acidobacteriota bacterium]MDD8030257.1 IMP cyclohydrolase [Acidobacteriota bacterium]